MSDAETARDLIYNVLDRYNSGESRLALWPDVERALAAARADERGKIVASMREFVANNDADDRFGPPVLVDNDTILKVAAWIERGDHAPPAGGTK